MPYITRACKSWQAITYLLAMKFIDTYKESITRLNENIKILMFVIPSYKCDLSSCKYLSKV